jgi:hypothetical protein
MDRRTIYLVVVIFLFALVLAFAALAHGQTAKNPYETPRTQPHRSSKVAPVIGKAAEKFMSRHPHLCAFLGNIDIEWDKPRKLRTEKTK